LTKSSLHI